MDEVRKDFPALFQEVYGHPLAYLDNAATTLKPSAVIQAISGYYSTINSNVHRGVHYLSGEATAAFENARENVRRFINAEHGHEVIFTKGATEAINLVAQSFSATNLGRGDEIVVSGLEHHANLVPWQNACRSAGATLKIIPFDEKGEISAEQAGAFLSGKTKLLALTHVSNSLGTLLPVKEIIQVAHRMGIPVLVDGAQGIVHCEVDVRALDCDFYCFSGHKIYGPMGIGILYGKERWLEAMEPYQTGGEMIKSVSYQHATYNDLPYKFEAGTPNVAGAVGLNAALEYMEGLGKENIHNYEKYLLAYTLKALENLPAIRIYGHPGHGAAVISFLMEGIHPYDAGSVIDRFGIAVRTGHHCAQPVMDRLGIPGTIRASLAFYNTTEEIDRLTAALLKVQEMFA